MGRGPFFVIEGASELHERQLARLLTDTISKHTGLTVLLREGSWEFSDNYPQILSQYLSGWGELPDEVVHHLFSAGRWEKMPEIMYQLTRQRVVIQHRYVASGQAHTLAGGKLTRDWCKQFQTGLLKPDLTIYVERDPQPDQDQDPESNSFWGPTHFMNPEMQQKIVQQFNNMKDTESDWITVNVAKMNPDQAMDHIRPAIIEKIIQCVDDNKDFLFY